MTTKFDFGTALKDTTAKFDLQAAFNSTTTKFDFTSAIFLSLIHIGAVAAFFFCS